jgi:hypothetical protein
MKSFTLLAMALAVSAVPFLTACEGDLSAPTRPRTGGILSPDNQEKDRAWQRENEAPKRNLPTGGGSEFPGQGKANQPASMMPAAVASGDSGEAKVITAFDMPGSKYASERAIPLEGSSGHLPEPAFPRVSYYRGPLPELVAKAPGAMPSVGSTPVPGTPWVVDHSWGEVLPLENYPHRDWSPAQTTYEAATVKHNPVYYSPIWNRLPVPQNDGSWTGNALSSLIEVPWMLGETVALPALMFCDPPLKQVTTQRLGHDPVYLGHLPADGAIVPSPVPGVIQWEYPFLGPAPAGPGTAPAATQPIEPTPGIKVAPMEDLGVKEPGTAPAR